jgi:hypothetical protein
MDESTDQKKQHIVTVAGFVGIGGAIFETERCWQKVLEDEDIKYFRASDCAGVDGPFKKYRQDPDRVEEEDYQRAFAVRNRLIDCIDPRLNGVAISVLIGDYKSVMATHPRAPLYFDEDPLFTALQMLMIETVRQVSQQLPNEVVAYVYDENSELKEEINSVYGKLKRRNPQWAKWMGSLSQLDDKETALLQAGDLMGSEGRRETQYWMKGEGEHTRVFERLRQNGNLWFIGALDKQHMLDIIKENIDDDVAQALATRV